ncbi:hypothetical protein LCGC14_0789960 [marine sediment metagenome]|uniref:Uncharacterized protein n=1 Tax=marine sediment metagenome TaxID=412755 RepID=A0A0F9SCW7_9ZZZZ
MGERTFWVALAHETILALAEDYPAAAEIVARSAAVDPAIADHLGLPEKAAVRAHYKRQHEMCS